MHRFQPSVDVPFEQHLPEHFDLGCLIVFLQREIRLFPVGPDAPALEPLHLAIHLLTGVGGGFLAQLDRRQGFALFHVHRLQNLQLDRQAVAIPAGHIAHPATLQHLVFVDHILEHLVQGVTHVQSTVGVRRSVVKRETGARVLQPKFSVNPVVSPEGL